MKTGTCKTCGKSFEYEPIIFFEGTEVFKYRNCSECDAKEIASNKAIAAQNALEQCHRDWTEICPPLYQQTDITRLPKASFKSVMDWKFGSQGLNLHGPTGCGKTRSMFQLVKRIIFEDKKTVQVFFANAFAHECGRKFFDGSGESWLSDLVKLDVLCFDDFGKMKLTERVESELSGLVETRIAHLKPIIVTTNFTGEALTQKMTEDRGAALVRRIREFCTPIAFI